MGLAAVDLGRALGARVIAAASTPEKLALARSAGADELIDYAREDLRERLRALAPSGVNLVYDPVGGSYAEPALRSLAPEGRFLVIGFAAGEIPRMPLNLVLLKSCQVVGVNWGGSMARDPDARPEFLLGALDALYRRGALHPVSPRIFPLERAGEALRALLDRGLAGKAVLDPAA